VLRDSSSTSDALRQRYDAFRAREVEYYKQVVPYRTLMRIAELARGRMHARGEFALGELTLAYEVDDIIAERMALPSFRLWERSAAATAGRTRNVMRRVEQLLLRLPSRASLDVAVLLLQPRAAGIWVGVFARGNRVVVIEPDPIEREAIVRRVAEGGHEALLRVIDRHETLRESEIFAAVVFSPAACADLSDREAASLIATLQARTVFGGVHVIEGLLRERGSLPRSLLRQSYRSWQTRVERGRREWSLVADHPQRREPVATAAS